MVCCVPSSQTNKQTPWLHRAADTSSGPTERCSSSPHATRQLGRFIHFRRSVILGTHFLAAHFVGAVIGCDRPFSVSWFLIRNGISSCYSSLNTIKQLNREDFQPGLLGKEAAGGCERALNPRLLCFILMIQTLRLVDNMLGQWIFFLRIRLMSQKVHFRTERFETCGRRVSRTDTDKRPPGAPRVLICCFTVLLHPFSFSSPFRILVIHQHS